MMNRLEFSTEINASDSTIWHALWNDKSYRDWVSVFYEGSYVITDNWEEGTKVLFLNPGKNGIYSMIEKHIPNRIMSFKHLGNVVDGQEQPMDDETKKWSGATETYSIFKGSNGYTLSVEIDIMDEHLDYMKTTFPKALERIKLICNRETKKKSL